MKRGRGVEEGKVIESLLTQGVKDRRVLRIISLVLETVLGVLERTGPGTDGRVRKECESCVYSKESLGPHKIRGRGCTGNVQKE